jgi:homoserine/homoserine lactone efflux protein
MYRAAAPLVISSAHSHKRAKRTPFMTLAAFITYCFTCVALALAPGPTVTVIVASSLRFGAKAGVAITAGTILGMLVWLFAAAIGLSAVTESQSVVFTVLRYAGAAYVIWLGIKLLLSDGSFNMQMTGKSDIASLATQGFAVILSNPKMFVLYGVIIPPLLSGFGGPVSGTLILGGTFVLAATICDLAYAFAAGRAGSWLMQRSHLRTIEIVAAVFLIGAGLWLALR